MKINELKNIAFAALRFLSFAGTTCDPKWLTKEYRKPWSI